MNIDELAEELKVEKRTLTHWAWGGADTERYDSFEIPKAKGGSRKIDEPRPRLKSIQKKLAKAFDAWFQPHHSAHGFRKGRGIKTNAEKHLRKPWVLNLDLQDFFPSIRVRRVCGILKKMKIYSGDKDPEGFEPSCASLIANLCCFREEQVNERVGLPQGSPSSPVLSNLFVQAIGLDQDLFEFAGRNGIEYSRYADDLSFSPRAWAGNLSYEKLVEVEEYGASRRHLRVVDLVPEFKAIFEKRGLELQTKKTRLQASLENKVVRKEVTGLVVNELPNVPRKEIRWIRGMLDLWSKKDYGTAQSRQRGLRENRHPECKRGLWKILLGKLLFVSMVRGKGDYVYLKLRCKLLSLVERDFGPFEEPDGKISLTDKNEKIRRNMPRMLKVELDDFPKRSPDHAGKLEAIFEAKWDMENPDVSMLKQTELGSWAYERLEWEIGSSTLHPSALEDRMVADLLRAEAFYVLSLNKNDDRCPDAYDKLADLWLSLTKWTGVFCCEIFSKKSYGNFILNHDWKQCVAEINEKYSAGIWDTEDLFRGANLISLAKNKNAAFRKQPFGSFYFWLCLAEIDSQNDVIESHRRHVRHAFEENPSLSDCFHEANETRLAIDKKDSLEQTVTEFRGSVLAVLKAFAGKR